MKSPGRRKFLGYMAVGLSTPFVLSACSDAETTEPDTGFIFDYFATDEVFDLSVASGDPTPTGVMLWTHIANRAFLPFTPLLFQVASDEFFSVDSLVLEGRVEAENINFLNDRTVHVDLDGLLESNRRYYYRFIYNNVASRTGRCRTAPAENEAIASLKFAVLTCQDYTNGYYGALNYIAEDDSIDYVMHLGDFIYETVGDPAFQNLPFEDRRLNLPGGLFTALGLDDYRVLYKAVRSDPFMQRAMENHTWIITTDDHETANDCYWDYELDTLGAPDHPFTTNPIFGNDLSLLTQLKLDSQRAWSEYIPARVTFDLGAAHPHQALSIYRDFTFGNLLQLFMTDTRTYRTPHPCGEDSRYAVLACEEALSDTQSIYGAEQREWLINGILSSGSQWKVLGNQTFMGTLNIDLKDQELLYNVDAWDGYQAERSWLMNELKTNKVENFVVLTGDLHSAIASQVMDQYRFILFGAYTNDNSPGVEFMTPAVTSANLTALLNLSEGDTQIATLLETTVRKTNQHVRYFNSSFYGYSTIEFTQDYCEWIAYSVDKNINSDAAERKTEVTFRKYPENAKLQKIT